MNEFLQRFSTTTCTAPTVTVLAINVETTPNANVNPNACRGGNGEKEFAKNAKTVVTTARDNAILIFIKDCIQAVAALLVLDLALS